MTYDDIHDTPGVRDAYRALVDCATKRNAEFVDLAVKITEGLDVAFSDLERQIREFADGTEQGARHGGEEADGALVGFDQLIVGQNPLPLADRVVDLLGRLAEIAQQVFVHSLAPSSVGPDGSVGVASAAGEGSAADADRPGGDH